MNSRDYLQKRFSDFYTEIDTQINQLSSCSLISLESADKHYLKKSHTASSKNEVENVIQAVKEFDVEIKNYLKKSEQEERKRKQKDRAKCKKYNVPPIWNDSKLHAYIEEHVLNDFDFDMCSESEEKPVRDSPKAHPKSILKKIDVIKAEKKRNVGTNVTFDSPSNVQQQQSTMTEEKKKDKTPCEKKYQTIKANDREIETFPTSGTSKFADKSERDSNEEGKRLPLQVSQTNRPQSAPSKLDFAPITLTSTTTRELGKRDDIVMLAESNLATSSELKRHMTACFLPILSIKGKCNIQHIYQLEILPTTSDLQLNEQCRAKNVHFYEYIYEPPPLIQQCADCEISPELNANRVDDTQKLLSMGVHTQTSTSQIVPSPTLTIPHVSTPLKHEEISATLSNLKSILDDIKINNGKIQVVVEKPTERKRKFLRKKLRPNLPWKQSHIRQSKATKVLEITHDVENSDSSLTDENFRDFLGYEKKKVEEETSGDPSSPTSVPIKNDSNDPPETSLNNNFKSFYELFEKTFEESTKRVEHAEKKKEAIAESDLLRIKEIISMSEENIKKAGQILQKYQQERADVSLQTSNTNVLKAAAEVSVQTSEIMVPQKCPSKPPESAPKVDSCVQTICDRDMQTDGYKSRHYFKHVYDKFSNLKDINFHQPPSSRPQHQSTSPSPSLMAKYLNDTAVPFNTSYSGNEEIMQMANKFLRSVEKHKKPSISAEESSSDFSSLDLNEKEKSEKSLSLSDYSSKKDRKASEGGNKLKESEIVDLLSGFESMDDDSSISSSILNF